MCATNLSLTIAELSQLSTIWILGVPGAGVIVEVLHQPILVGLLHVAIVVVDCDDPGADLLPVAIAVPYLHSTILVPLLSCSSLSVDNDLGDLGAGLTDL